MAKSILQTERECFKTGATGYLHSHHVFFGNNRPNSEKYGLKIWLTPEWHNLCRYGIHQNKEFDNEVKAWAQAKAMEYYGWSIEEFRAIFGRNYI